MSKGRVRSLVMKIPGTPRRTSFELEGVLDDFVKAVDGFSTTFTVTAEQFSSSFAKAFGFDNTMFHITEKTQDDYDALSYEEKNNDAMYFLEGKSKPQARLTPAICSCCGGRIGKDNYCEFCGTRYW